MVLLTRVLLAFAVAGVLAGSGAAAPSSLRSVAFVSIHGQGAVTSTPNGIHCPSACRGIFVKNAHVTLRAKAAPGWKVGHFEGWCKSRSGGGTCSFDLVSPHDCAGGACPIGAFGVRAYFVRRSGSA